MDSDVYLETDDSGRRLSKHYRGLDIPTLERYHLIQNHAADQGTVTFGLPMPMRVPWTGRPAFVRTILAKVLRLPTGPWAFEVRGTGSEKRIITTPPLVQGQTIGKFIEDRTDSPRAKKITERIRKELGRYIVIHTLHPMNVLVTRVRPEEETMDCVVVDTGDSVCAIVRQNQTLIDTIVARTGSTDKKAA